MVNTTHMINHPHLAEIREKIRNKNNEITSKRMKWISSNQYYYSELLKSLRFIIGKNSRVLHIRCGIGYLLGELAPAYGVGVDDSEMQISVAKKKYSDYRFINQSPESIDIDEKFDYILITSIEDIVDLKAVLDSASKCCLPHTRIILIHYNFIWEPFTKLAEKLKMRIPQKVHNWLSTTDIDGILLLSGYDMIKRRRLILNPFYIPLLSSLLNRFIAQLPFFRYLTMLSISVARHNESSETKTDYSVSVIIPCKNEAGNIEAAVKRIPFMGRHTEIIFGDDKSTDGTPSIVNQMIEKYPNKDIKLVAAPGIGKAQNVWTCFDLAKGDILMICDADLTVIPEELPYFYDAISKRYGEFINGSRLVYEMHDQAMRLLNIIGNKFFSIAFTYILSTKIKDTLCGTKTLWRRDYENIKKLRGSWGIDDRWCDYELIFGAAKMNLKIIDMPVHYMERTYGETKMKNRLKNGWIMLRMCWVALFKIKLY